MPRSKARCDNFIYTWAGPDPGPRIDRSHWSSSPLRRDAKAHAYVIAFLEAFDIEMLFLQYISCIIEEHNAFSDGVCLCREDRAEQYFRNQSVRFTNMKNVNR